MHKTGGERARDQVWRWDKKNSFFFNKYNIPTINQVNDLVDEFLHMYIFGQYHPDQV
jgi:hypothetical protein